MSCKDYSNEYRLVAPSSSCSRGIHRKDAMVRRTQPNRQTQVETHNFKTWYNQLYFKWLLYILSLQFAIIYFLWKNWDLPSSIVRGVWKCLKQVTTTARVVLVVCVYMRRKTLYQKATTLSYTDNKRISSARGAAVAPTTTMTAQTTTFCTRDHSLKITRIKTVTLSRQASPDWIVFVCLIIGLCIAWQYGVVLDQGWL